MACCKACQIGSMKKKKKNTIAGVSERTAMDAVATAIGVPAGVAVAHFGKQQIIPMLTEGADAETAKSTAMYTNLATGALGIAVAVGGAYLKDEQPEAGSFLIGMGAGMATQAGYAWYVNRNGGTGAIAKSWDVKAWQEAARNAAMRGVDNASPGVMGADNASPGVMGAGLIKKPFLTNLENNIGRYNRMGSCGM